MYHLSHADECTMKRPGESKSRAWQNPAETPEMSVGDLAASACDLQSRMKLKGKEFGLQNTSLNKLTLASDLSQRLYMFLSSRRGVQQIKRASVAVSLDHWSAFANRVLEPAGQALNAEYMYILYIYIYTYTKHSCVYICIST